MNRRLRQSGAIMLLVVIGMIGILAVSGLALSMGNAYLVKARLQNSLDAAALSGAKVLDQTDGDTSAAQIAALDNFDQVWRAVGVNEDLVPIVEFSDTLDPFVAGGSNPAYIRVRTSEVTLPLWLVTVVPGAGDSRVIGGSAVSGPSPPLGTTEDAEICDVIPLVICGDPEADTDCTDYSCFGYDFDPLNPTEITLKSGVENPNDEWEIGPGNFQLLDFDCPQGGGAACLRDYLAGAYQGCVNQGDSVTTEPGNTTGPVAQGLNTRFGIYKGPVSPEEFPPDKVTALEIWHDEYENRKNSPDCSACDFPDGVFDRRIVAVPIGDCSETVSGKGDVPMLGIGCFFLTQPAGNTGQTSFIYGQMIGNCAADGDIGEDPGDATGPILYRIILYKDPDSLDS